MEKETANDVRGMVSSVLGDAYARMQDIKKERDEYKVALASKTYNEMTGKIRGIAEVIDVFTGLGFEIGGSRD